MSLSVRPATRDDRAAIWRILDPIVRAGETYPYPRDWSADEALAVWCGPDKSVFVAENETGVLGTYYLRANGVGAASHVANCGYAVAGDAAGRGVASGMCRHSLDEAHERGFRAMQFNLVVSTNQRAVRLWQRMGFDIVGTLPGAFAHPSKGDVDAYVMYQTLEAP